ncbi:conserved hypothetical protein [Burkholderia sp. IT-111MI5]
MNLHSNERARGFPEERGSGVGGSAWRLRAKARAAGLCDGLAIRGRRTGRDNPDENLFFSRLRIV